MVGARFALPVPGEMKSRSFIKGFMVLMNLLMPLSMKRTVLLKTIWIYGRRNVRVAVSAQRIEFTTLKPKRYLLI